MKKIIIMLMLCLAILAPSVLADKPDLRADGMTTLDVSDTGEVSPISAFIRNLRAQEAGEFKSTIEISPSTFKVIEGSLSQTNSGLSGGGQIVHSIKVTFDKEGTYKITAKVDPNNKVDETNENNNQQTTDVRVGATAIASQFPPRPPTPISEEEEEDGDFERLLREKQIPNIPTATPTTCRVPAEFRDKTDTAVLAFWSPGETPKWAHGKKYGKLYLEGGYWLTLKEIKAKTATIDVNGKTTTIKEGESKEINGVVVYIYRADKDFIDYCIHETAAQSLQFTCIQGCVTDSQCLPFGARLVIDEKPSYCGFDKKLETQKGKEVTCQNNYECTSNFCSDNKCVALGEKLGLLDRIASFLKKIFGFKG